MYSVGIFACFELIWTIFRFVMVNFVLRPIFKNGSAEALLRLVPQNQEFGVLGADPIGFHGRTFY